jgi:hypothetical protein
VELVLDEERHILNGRTQGSRVQVYDLGRDGRSGPRKVAEEANIGERGLGGDGSPRGRLARKALVSISTVTTAESQRVHLVATTVDGRRIYLTTIAAGRLGAEGSQQVREGWGESGRLVVDGLRHRRWFHLRSI